MGSGGSGECPAPSYGGSRSSRRRQRCSTQRSPRVRLCCERIGQDLCDSIAQTISRQLLGFFTQYVVPYGVPN